MYINLGKHSYLITGVLYTCVSAHRHVLTRLYVHLYAYTYTYIIKYSGLSMIYNSVSRHFFNWN
jgi:hypothetical protein